MTEAERIAHIPKIEYSYGDKKELPNCLLREIHEAMFYWVKDFHPNQKYKTDDLALSTAAAQVALKYIESEQYIVNDLREQLKGATAEHERLQQLIKEKADRITKLTLFSRMYQTDTEFLKEELKSAQELIGDIQASWEQFGALTSDLEERIKLLTTKEDTPDKSDHGSDLQ